MGFGRWILVPLAAVAVIVAAYWLIADTVRYYRSDADAEPLRVCYFGSAEEFHTWQAMLDAFREQNPQIEVRGEYVASRYDFKVQQLMVAGDAADVILFQDEPFFGMVESGNFEDLTPFLAQRGEGAARLEELNKRYWPSAVQSFGRWEGRGEQRQWRQYAIPVWGGCNLIYYNKAAFAAAGIRIEKHDGDGGIRELEDGVWLLDDDRWTISDFVRVCQRLTILEEGASRPSQYGTLLPDWLYWLTMHWSMGARVLSDDKLHTMFYGPECEASLQLYQDLRWTYRVAPQPADLGTMDDATGFFTGLTAMFNSGPWRMPFCNAVADEGLAYDMLHIPRNDRTGYRATRITWDALAMYSGSRKKQEAWKLIEHLSSEQTLRAVAELQRAIPATRPPDDVVERAIQQGRPEPADQQYAAVYFITVNPKVSARKFVEATWEYGRLQPITGHWMIMARTWADSLNGLQRVAPTDRYTPAEAIGRFYADKGDARKLKQVLPPLDPGTAAAYQAIYEGSGKP